MQMLTMRSKERQRQQKWKVREERKIKITETD